MSLSKIYSSKLYLTSNRQDKIHAAIQNPVNLELVQQVAAYLDDDSKKDLKQAIEEKEIKPDQNLESVAAPEANENVFDTPDFGSGFGSGSAFSGGGHSSGGFSGGNGNVFDDFSSEVSEGDMPEGGDSAPAPESSEPSAPAPESSEPSEPVEETTEITGVDEIDSKDSAVLQSGIIKKLLNDQEDTSGVVRVDIDDTETWIYYNDKVNLNDIFDNVIALLKDYKYDMLKFSRLARTDNAVVFDIKD